MGKVESESWYFDMVEKAADEKSSLLIANGMPEHARYLIQTLFRVANKSMYIFSGELRCIDNSIEVYAHRDLIREALAFIAKPNAQLHILIEKDITTDNAFIKALQESKFFNEAVTLKKVVDQRLSHHVIVSDKKAFRFEADDEKVKAIANFNDPKKSAMFAEKFSSIFSGAKEIHI